MLRGGDAAGPGLLAECEREVIHIILYCPVGRSTLVLFCQV